MLFIESAEHIPSIKPSWWQVVKSWAVRVPGGLRIATCMCICVLTLVDFFFWAVLGPQQNWAGNPEGSHQSLNSLQVQPPLPSTSHQRGTSGTVHEATGTHLSHPKPIVDVRMIAGCCALQCLFVSQCGAYICCIQNIQGCHFAKCHEKYSFLCSVINYASYCFL